MEEVLVHMHPGPIVPDVLSRQHEHRSSLICSGDHETCYTDLQCRRFGRNLFQCYNTAPHRLMKKEPLESWILRAFTGSETDDDLILRARGFIFLLICGHMLPDFSENLVHVRYLSSCAQQHWGCTTDWGDLSLSTDLGVVAYTCIATSADYEDLGRPSCSSWRNMLPTHTLVTYRDQLDFMPSYQFARAQMVSDACDTRLDLHRIQLRGNTWRLRVRDGPAVAAEALSYLSHEYIRWNHLHLLHRWPCLRRKCRRLSGGTFLVQPSRRRPREHASDHGARGVKRCARRHPGRGAGGRCPPVPPAPERHKRVDPGHVEVENGEGSGSGQPPVDPFDGLNLDMPSFSLGLTLTSQSLPSGSGTSQTPPPPGLGLASFQAPHSTSYGFSGFRAPLLWAQPVHLHCISLYRRHLCLIKRSGRMTWMVYSVTYSGIVLDALSMDYLTPPIEGRDSYSC
ncbi:hypothetical protein M9H77_31256 [Catharanthus roseus]|uniref:Uncharacterized protein n=1 Tax=Catharanthus roseus TaxID=4058 RepID=A0ACB9ZZW2_CATRO|nr:hypothetical protein M9H77_31256 [Catharanthus roseus]